MANEDHIVQIRRWGRSVWNKWRKENPDVVPDFRNANLNNADLYDVDLSGADLRGASLLRAYLSGANLQGANLSRAGLNGANLLGANFSDANLSDANLHDADLRGADFRGADLSGTDLSDAALGSLNHQGESFRGANLSRANLRGKDFRRWDLRDANFSDADFGGANLSGADLGNADLRRTTLIDSWLDGANLTGAKLWETQRGGWSIKGITCQRAFWDRDGNEPTEYEDGAFERIFAEKPRIVLRYAGGISPVDLAMLPIIIERLQADHPNSSLHIRSVQDDGSGATVTITVEDLVGRSDEAFAQDVEVMRGDLATLQQRLRQEERLRLDAEAGYRTMVQDVLPRLLDRALPKTEVHVGQITGPTIIEGTAMMSKDTYNIHGQTGAVGRNAHAHDMTFQQIWNQSSIDLQRLAEELKRLRSAMKEADDKDEQDEAIGAVAAAEKAAIKGDGPSALGHLKAVGRWVPLLKGT